MKKIISILLAVMLVVSVAVMSVSAEYAPEESYTVTKDTPTCEEAIVACGGDLSNTQTIYFQCPEDWKMDGYNVLEGNDYTEVCVYWASGIGTKWPSGAEQKWVGYRATLVDAANRIYSAKIPLGTSKQAPPYVIWNNGVNGGMDESDPIFKKARQLMNLNIQGLEEEEEDSLPEGTPDPDSQDGCIAIIDKSVFVKNELTGFDNYGANWYVYYGSGCYGQYAQTSDHFVSKYANCINPEHLADPDKYHPLPGDVNKDKIVDSSDATCIQRHLVGLEELTDAQKVVADVDEDTYISVMDATRIQRYLAKKCNLDGTPYKEELM